MGDIFLPSIPANKRASGEGEIHITHDGGAATMILSVPNRDAVYRVSTLFKINEANKPITYTVRLVFNGKKKNI